MKMNSFYKYKNIEFSKPAAIRDAQEIILKNHLYYIFNISPYYRRDLNGIDLNKITLKNLSSLPFTDKSAFENHNNELLAVPASEIVDIVLSSGTTGQPTKIMYTENDLKRLAYNEELSFAGCGINSDDTVLLTCTMDRCFIAGLAYYLGIRALGAAAVRNGLNSFESHMEIINRLKPTAIVGVPSFLHKLGLFLQSKGIEPRKTNITKLVCIGEPLRDRDLSLLKMGGYLEEIWGAKVFSTYASSETITTFCECTAQKGGHLHPELAIAEIVNDNGEVLPPGEIGEVVVTTFFIEGMPLLRFKTGDVSLLIDEPCGCGRFSPRLGPIIGRKKHMIKYRGTTLYPQAVYSVLDEMGEIAEYYIAVTSDFDLSDALKVYVSIKNNSCSAEMIMDKLQAHLRVRPEVIISSEEEIRTQVFAGNSRKAIRFIDRRTNQ
ncbi:MAG: AMP-binding protein [Nitrospirae bacterium]|nr:AMP-binding protein [Nitrospirota bacterium]